MIAHQNKGMDQPAVSLRNLIQSIQENLMIPIVLKNRCLTVSPTHHMIGRALKFNSRFPCHGVREAKKTPGFNLK
jgi:hypothetical protein